MEQYLNLLDHVMTSGKTHQNRTGVPTRRLLGAQLDFDMNDGFPAVTTKKLAFNAVKGELLGFIDGVTNAKGFRDRGCSIWDQNANENKAWLENPHRQGTDDLGRIYGAQWRRWNGGTHGDHRVVDQLANAVHEIVHNPQSRRIIVSAWQPAELDRMALPPCHVMHQYHVDEREGTLSMTMYQRSCDLFLGVPFNIASYALLLHLVAKATGLRAHQLTMFLADVHIYQNHFDQVAEQLHRSPLPLPTLEIPGPPGGQMHYLENVSNESIKLLNYHYHPAITAPMAV